MKQSVGSSLEMTGMRDVRAYGARGDGASKDTAAIQRAIDAGGVVYFPQGTYLSGTLYLKSGTELRLSRGAVLLASPDREDYNSDDFCQQCVPWPSENVSAAHFIIALECQDIAIVGPGRIDGNRQAFEYKDDPAYLYPRNRLNHDADPKFAWASWRPNAMLFICECRNVTICDVELTNPPFWTCKLHGCSEVTYRGNRTSSDPRTHQTDGLDIDCCRNVTVSDSQFFTGDDGITLRGSSQHLKHPQPCEHVTISNCVIRAQSNGFRIGVGNEEIRNCVISNCVIYDSRSGICLNSQYADEVPGLTIRNISFSNLEIEAERPVNIVSSYAAKNNPDCPAGSITDISFSQLHCTGSRGIIINGCGTAGLSRLRFSGCTLTLEESEFVQTSADGRFAGDNPKPSPPAPIFVKDAAQVDFINCTLRCEGNVDKWSCGMLCRNCQDVRSENCRFELAVNRMP